MMHSHSPGEEYRLLEEATAALQANDCMRARELATDAVHCAWASVRAHGGSKPDEMVNRIWALLREVQTAEGAREPLTIASPLADLFSHCESFCVAACCGTDAFDQAAAQYWIRTEDVETRTTAAKRLEELIHTLGPRADSDDRQVLWSGLFEVAWTAERWRTYFREWAAAIDTAMGKIG